ncbi:bifunctional enoyl-CoA hydratase/phosphate acetyltransferase [bacterium]|nr:bifunctional enoyl-CoA hydratase/phosphate acetyltransferase [bacterium]
MMTTYADILAKAASGEKKRIAIAGAEGSAVLEAITVAADKGLAEAVLVGDRRKIEEIAEASSLSLNGVEIHHETDETACAHTAVSLVDHGEADCLMKGNVSTPVLLKAVLDEQYSLRTDRLLSHITVLQVDRYPKLLMITDGGMVIRPDLAQKKEIVRNGIEIMRKLGVMVPKIAVLAAIEKVNPKMVETEHAAALAEAAAAGAFGECLLEGPVAVDVAFSAEAARIKGVESLIAGEPDILVVPDIACGNIFAKGLWHLAGAKLGGLVAGARKPIILLSRSDDAETKLNSIALGAVTS